MKSKVKQMLSVILTVCMLATVVPLNAYAADVDFSDNDITDVTVEADTATSAEETADVDISEEDTEENSDISVETESEDTETEEDDVEADLQDEELFTADEETADFSAETTESITDCYALTGAPDPVFTENFFRIMFIDCGRKYFSVDSLKAIIDNAAAAGFNYVELGVGNDGLRFLLDDLSLTVNGTTYDSSKVSSAIHTGNEKYYNFATDELTQTQMDTIIEYASDKGIGVIPMLNTPGHMDAILSAANSLTGVTCSYNGSARTIDVTNETAVAFTQALVQKYIDYFAGKGCKLFNMGADEYANDKYTSGSMGFGNLQSTGKYSYYVAYVNKIADMVKAAGMTPMAFNDGIYFNGNTASGTFDNSIVICYWSCGWDSYKPMAAEKLSNMGFRMINTHGDYYWVLGKSDWQCSETKASGFDYKSFQGGTIDNPLGAMFCIWCDYPGAGTEASVIDATQATIAAFGKTLPASEATPTPTESAEATPTPPANDAIGMEKRRITVAAGSTTSDTIDNANYAGDYTTEDENIATVEVTGVDEVENTVDYGQKTDKSIGGLATSTNWADTGYYIRDGENYYPLYAKYETTGYLWPTTTYYWGYSTDGGGSVTPLDSSNRSNTKVTVYTQTETPGTPASTTATFTGINVGTTTVTIGNVEYTITVTEEDLSAVTLPVEYWITNRQVTANSVIRRSISAAEENVNSENGVAFSGLVPEEGTQDGNITTFWKGTRLLNGNEQTKDSGVDKTKAGEDFTYVRYWNHKWSFSNNGTDWKNFNSDDQVVAYYLQVTDVTDEITTEVVDWGVVPHTDYTSSDFVLVDYAVKYQSGLRTPDSFPVSGKTQAFHCDSKDTTSVHEDEAGNTYRTIGMIRAEETADYEVYMITLTPSSDSVTDRVASKCNYATSYEYNGTEKVIWVDDEKNLGDFTEESLHHADFKVGGDPIVDHLNIYNKQGMLVTYYIRTKQTEESLTVNYIDENTKSIFYDYNIAVKQGTYFDEKIDLDDPWKGPLVKGAVVNSLGKTETVSADLKTLPQISGQYLYSKYTCVRVERSNDGKTVNLYYTFEDTIRFVVDYGLPIVITREDIGTETAGGWDDATVKGAEFGTAVLDKTNGTLTYTPTKVLTEVETLQLTLKGTDKDNKEYKVTFQIYIYPASTVYYEENFAKFAGGFDGGNSGREDQRQTVENVTNHTGNYGYDESYSANHLENSGASSGQAAHSNAYGAKATFTFTGTGVDIYANCTQSTSQAMVTIYSGDTLVKMYAVDTKIGKGTTAATQLQANLQNAYSVPIVSAQGLDYGEYTVNIAQMKNDSRTGLNFDGFRVYDPLPEANRVYYADSEKNPHYVELRNKVLAVLPDKSDSIYADKISGKILEQVYTASEQDKIVSAVVVDQNSDSIYSETDLQDLLDNGSKNELYLYRNQSLVMKLNSVAQIGLKGVNGIASYSVSGGTINGKTADKVSTTDMFYPITAGTVTITNTSDVVLSITKLKVCGGVSPTSLFAPLTEESLTAALVSLGYEKAPDPTATPTVKPTQKPSQQIKLATPKLGKVVSAGYNALKLNWSKVKGADGYRVYVKVNGQWKSLGDVKGTTYVHKHLETGKSYTFTVKAYKKTKSGIVWSSYDKKGVTGKVTLSAPSLRKAKRISAKKATLSWKKVDGANGYVVYRKTNNGRWQIIKKITKGSTTSFTDTKLSKGKKYTYTVRAYRTVGKKNVYSGYNAKGLTVK